MTMWHWIRHDWGQWEDTTLSIEDGLVAAAIRQFYAPQFGAGDSTPQTREMPGQTRTCRTCGQREVRRLTL